MVYGTRGEDFGEAIGNTLSDLAVVLYLRTEDRRSSEGERGGKEGVDRGRGETEGRPRVN